MGHELSAPWRPTPDPFFIWHSLTCLFSFYPCPGCLIWHFPWSWLYWREGIPLYPSPDRVWTRCLTALLPVHTWYDVFTLVIWRVVAGWDSGDMPLNFLTHFVLLCNWLLLWSSRIPGCYPTSEERAQRRNRKPAGISLWFYWTGLLMVIFLVCWSKYSSLVGSILGSSCSFQLPVGTKWSKYSS